MTIGPVQGGYAARKIRHEQRKAAEMQPRPFDSVCAVTLGALFFGTLATLGFAEAAKNIQGM